VIGTRPGPNPQPIKEIIDMSSEDTITPTPENVTDALILLCKIQNFGTAFLALAEKESLPSRFTDLIEAMVAQADKAEDLLQ
jgi:hypothetical protein